MRAITLRQPFAHLAVTGQKRFETRKWVTSYKGPLLIHAASSVYAEPIAGHEGIAIESLPLRAIIGMVEVIGCFDPSRPQTGPKAATRTISDAEHAMGFYGPGWYAWELANPVKFRSPIPCIGNVGIWIPPTSVLERIKRLTSKDVLSHAATTLKSAS